MAEEKKVKIIRGKQGSVNDVLRVAAYCRVSADSDDQINSFIAQMHYYYNFIQQSENMELVDVYADEGISGTSVAKRDEFNRMIADCKAGKIDRIYVKSVSRFARNALDCLEYIRLLKENGVSVFFENDGIDTMTLNSELVLYIKSAFAQAEAVSGSKRMQTANRMRAESGDYIFKATPFGFRREDNQLIPIPEQISVVKRIFKEYLAGNGMGKITVQLNADPDVCGKPWGKGRVRYILTNEKYVGDSLFQKTYTPSIFPFRSVPNHGEKDKLYITNTHTAIIDRETFDAVQEMLKSNLVETSKKSKAKKYNFTGIIYCGFCGWAYKRKIQNGSVYWVCSHNGAVGQKCNTKPLSEDALFRTFINFYNRLRFHENRILQGSITKLTEMKKIITCMDSEIGEIDKQIAKMTERYNYFLTLMNAQKMDEVSFAEECSKIENTITKLRKKRRKLINEDEDEKAIDELRMLREKLSDAPIAILEFDFNLFNTLVEKVIINDEKYVSFVLRCGLKLREAIAWN